MPENQYFCDGLTEELINHLAQIPQLRVVARTSSFQFKDAARDIREVGRLLDVSKVLEGSVRKAGNRIRVTVQLINVARWLSYVVGAVRRRSDRHLRDPRKDLDGRPAGTADEMLGRIASLRARRPPRASRPTTSICRDASCGRSEPKQGLRAALDHFDASGHSSNPTFARALSGIADCHLMLGMSAAEAPERCMPKAAEAAIRALQLDDCSRRGTRVAGRRQELLRMGSCRGRGRATAVRSSSIRVMRLTLHWLGLFCQAAGGRFGGSGRLVSNRPSNWTRCLRRSSRTRFGSVRSVKTSMRRRCTVGERWSSIRISIDRSGFWD